MTLYLYALVAGMCAVALETMFRKSNLHYLQLLWLTIPVQVVLGYCIWVIFTRSEYLFSGAVIFSTGTAVARILATYLVLKETPSVHALVAFGLIMLAQFVKFIPIK